MLDELKLIPAYNQPLKAEELLEEPPGHALYNACMKITTTAQGKAPSDFPAMTEVSNLPSPLPALNGNQVLQLYQFLHNNRGYGLSPVKEDGDCFYGSFRRGTKMKAEVADIHLKRMIIKSMAKNYEFFYKTFHYAVAQQYGLYRHPEEKLQELIRTKKISDNDLRDQRLPGPFSWYEFLKHHLTPSTYADDIIICTVSMLWQIKITVLKAQDLSERRFHHNSRISRTELLLLHCENTEHFVGAGKRSYILLRDFK